jgi:hypothetical protein
LATGFGDEERWQVRSSCGGDCGCPWRAFLFPFLSVSTCLHSFESQTLYNVLSRVLCSYSCYLISRQDRCFRLALIMITTKTTENIRTARYVHYPSNTEILTQTILSLCFKTSISGMQASTTLNYSNNWELFQCSFLMNKETQRAILHKESKSDLCLRIWRHEPV